MMIRYDDVLAEEPTNQPTAERFSFSSTNTTNTAPLLPRTPMGSEDEDTINLGLRNESKRDRQRVRRSELAPQTTQVRIKDNTMMMPFSAFKQAGHVVGKN